MHYIYQIAFHNTRQKTPNQPHRRRECKPSRRELYIAFETTFARFYLQSGLTDRAGCWSVRVATPAVAVDRRHLAGSRTSRPQICNRGQLIRQTAEISRLWLICSTQAVFTVAIAGTWRCDASSALPGTTATYGYAGTMFLSHLLCPKRV